LISKTNIRIPTHCCFVLVPTNVRWRTHPILPGARCNLNPDTSHIVYKERNVKNVITKKSDLENKKKIISD